MGKKKKSKTGWTTVYHDGEISIVEIPKSSCLYYRFNVDGVRFCKSSKTDDLELAVQIGKDKKRRELKRRRGIKEDVDYTLGDLASRFLLSTIGKKSYEWGARRSAIILNELGKDRTAISVTSGEVEVFRRKLRIDYFYSDATINRVLAVLRRMYNLYKNELNSYNPCHNITRLPETGDREMFLPEEIDQMLAAAWEMSESVLLKEIKDTDGRITYFLSSRDKNKFYFYAFLVLLAHGIREDEAINAEWKNVNSGYIMLFKTKTKRDRPVHISRDTYEYLMMLKAKIELLNEPSLYIIGTSAVKKVKFGPGPEQYNWERDPNAFKRCWYTLKQKCRFIKGRTMYGFRHSFITHLLERSIPIHTVKEMAGHASIITTQGYTHVTDSGRKAASAAHSQIIQFPHAKGRK